MKSLFKLLFWMLGLCLVLLIAVVVAIATLDPNSHKDWIITTVEEETGRTLALDGAINLSWYPWLGLEVNDLTVGNAPGFGSEPFFHTDYAKFRIKLVPIFHQQYEVDTIQFHGTVINLAKNKDGVTNWDDLMGEKKQRQAFPLTSLILGGVDIKDARLTWTDAGTDTHQEINKMNLAIGELVYGEPIDISLSLDVTSNKPALSGDALLTGTIAYDQKNETVAVRPLNFSSHLKGKNIPGGRTEVMLSTAVDIDLDKDNVIIPELALSGLGTSVNGDLEIQKAQSSTPLVKTNLKIEGSDLSLLFKVAEIEPLASQIAGLKNRRFKINTTLEADMDRGDVNVSELTADLLDAEIRGEVKARNIQSKTPELQGRVIASGPDLPTLLQVVGQFETGENKTLRKYGKQLSNIPAQQKSFMVNTKFDADLKAGDIEIPEIALKGLGITVDGGLTARDMQAKQGTVTGNLAISGTNMSAVLAAIDQQAAAEVLRDFNVKSGISGTRSDISLKPLALTATFAGKQIPNSPATLTLNADTRIDLDSDQLSLDNFTASGLGLNLKGDIKARRFQSDAPGLQGKINASGENLPVLMELLGRFQTGEDPALLVYGKRLGALPKDYKRFRLDTQFDAEPKKGNYDIPEISFNGLGLTVQGQLRSKDMQNPGGSINGNIDINSRDPAPLLTALDKKSIAEVIQGIHIESGVSGSRSNLNLKPLALTATVLNKQTPNAPVNLSLSADTSINLESEQLRLDNFSVNGLGLNAKGSLTAGKIMQAPEFSGSLDVPAFNLRELMSRLNMEVPNTKDKNALTRVALASRFSGSAQNMNISDLRLALDESTLLGKLSVTDFEKPATTFDINIDRFNADRYLEPVAEGKNRAPVTPEAAAGAAVQLPVEMLQSLNASGSFRVKEFIFSNIRMTDVSLTLQGKDGDIRLDPLSAGLYRGQYKGDIKLNAAGKVPRLTINSSLKGVQIEPLLLDYMGKADLTGTADISIAAFTVGSDTSTLKRSLNGQGEVHVSNGILRGIDVRKVLEQIEIMIESKAIRGVDRGEQTIFDRFDLRFNMNNGVARSEQFLMTSPGIRVTGEGILADLHNDAILYKMLVEVDEETATRNEERYNIGGYSLPVKCQGKIQSPDCKPEYTDIVKTIIQKSLIEKLMKNAGDTQGQSTGQDVSGQQQVDPTQQILNKALEGIFKK